MAGVILRAVEKVPDLGQKIKGMSTFTMKVDEVDFGRGCRLSRWRSTWSHDSCRHFFMQKGSTRGGLPVVDAWTRVASFHRQKLTKITLAGAVVWAVEEVPDLGGSSPHRLRLVRHGAPNNSSTVEIFGQLSNPKNEVASPKRCFLRVYSRETLRLRANKRKRNVAQQVTLCGTVSVTHGHISQSILVYEDYCTRPYITQYDSIRRLYNESRTASSPRRVSASQETEGASKVQGAMRNRKRGW